MGKKNAFWYFMAEQKRELENAGRQIGSFHELPAISGPKWERMSKSERAPYERRAKEEDWSESPGLNGGRNDGILFDDDDDGWNDDASSRSMKPMVDEKATIKAKPFVSREQEAMLRLRKLEDDVRTLRMSWPPGNELVDERFYLIHAEYFVKTQDHHYYPCEVAGLQFSLREGIVSIIHTFVDPGPCPKGYMYEERYRSENRHEIPLCDRFNIMEFTDADRQSFKDHGGIVDSLVAFFSRDGVLKYPRAFTNCEEIETVEGCLAFLTSSTSASSSAKLPEVLPLERLLQQFYLHSLAVGVTAVPSLNSVQRLLTQSTWDYEPGIRCKYHEELETRFCCRAQVHRWAFATFDAMKIALKVYDFELTRRHMPASMHRNLKLARGAESAALVTLPPKGSRFSEPFKPTTTGAKSGATQEFGGSEYCAATPRYKSRENVKTTFDAASTNCGSFMQSSRVPTPENVGAFTPPFRPQGVQPCNNSTSDLQAFATTKLFAASRLCPTARPAPATFGSSNHHHFGAAAEAWNGAPVGCLATEASVTTSSFPAIPAGRASLCHAAMSLSSTTPPELTIGRGASLRNPGLMSQPRATPSSRGRGIAPFL